MMVKKQFISPDERQQFESDGFIYLRNVVMPESLIAISARLRHLVSSLTTDQKPLEERSTYGKAFTQVTNLWKHDAQVKSFVFDTELAKLAAEILGVSGVRLYHDQALFKEAGGGATPWHVDQVYWPMDTPKTCTFWIPLQDTSIEMGALSFARGTHKRTDGRELVISDESNQFFSDWVKQNQIDIVQEGFELGDLSVHTGWTVHFAGANQTSVPREVMTIIYMADDARILDKPSKTQLVDRDAFLPGCEPGDPAHSALTPRLYPI